MKIVGITGGIGSGKSTLCNALARNGFPVYNSDLEARRIIDSDEQVISTLKHLFGNDIYVNGHLDRRRVADCVFHDPQMLASLNRATHPAVKADMIAWSLRHASAVYGFVESAILHSSGLADMCHFIILVDAPVTLRIRRTIERDHTDAAQVQARITQQEAQFQSARADIRLNNDGTHTMEQLAEMAIHSLNSLGNP